jgi:NYN domain
MPLIDAFELYDWPPTAPLLRQFSRPSYRRAVFYFATDDPQVPEFIKIPDLQTPGIVRDVSFRECGERLRMPAGYDEWYAQQPEKFRQFCSKREKGVDIAICCDALQLAALRNLDRLKLLTNDSDFVPLCEMLKAFGSNITLIQLSSYRPVNQNLVKACDSFSVLSEAQLNNVFEPLPG